MTSIRHRLFAILLMATGLVWVSAMAWIQHSTRISVGQVLDRRLEESARMVASLMARGDGPVELPTNGDQAPALADSGPHDLTRQLICQVWGFDGQLRSGSTGAPADRLAEGRAGFSERTVDGETWRVYTHVDTEQGIRVMIGDALSIREALVNDVILGLLAPALMILPFVALLIWWAVHHGLQPLNRLALLLSRRQATDLQALPEHPAAKELHPMIASLNDLFARVEALRDRERNFTAFAAHELKTPLAGLKTQAQIATIAPDAATRERALAQIRAGVDRTDRMVRQLLDLTLVDGAAAGRGDEAGATILSDVADSLRPMASAKDVHIAIEATAGDDVVPDAALLAAAIRNMIENAVQAAPASSIVEARMRQEDGWMVFEVLDRGPGIPDADRPRVTERFYRCATSRSGGGSGLGLSIVAAAAARMKGRLELSARAAGGECARLILPAYHEKVLRSSKVDAVQM